LRPSRPPPGAARGDPQVRQNRAPAGFAWPHRAQVSMDRA
jgi:hypothetical protein